jgi:S1/P1 nuclease
MTTKAIKISTPMAGQRRLPPVRVKLYPGDARVAKVHPPDGERENWWPRLIVDGFSHKARDELHGFWDTQFVDAVGAPPAALAKQLLAQITPADASEWAAGSTEDWAMETFKVAKADVYGSPPLSKDQTQHLDSNYVDTAEVDVSLQLSRAGIRLAHMLNTSLGSEPDDWSACLRAGR